jgi:opacity protein-like surface antigen
MKKILACAAAAGLLAVPAHAADSWKGTISGISRSTRDIR